MMPSSSSSSPPSSSLEQPRSSDSDVDLDHAVTLWELRELRELTLEEKHCESPPALPPTLSSSTQPGHDNPSLYAPSHSHVARPEKLLVFRDDADTVCEPAAAMRVQTKKNTRQNAKAHVMSRDGHTHLRSKSNPAILDTPTSHTPKDHGDAKPPTDRIDGVETAIHECVVQLRAIADQRSRLLRDLHHLDQQEQDILTSLLLVCQSSASATFHKESATVPLKALHVVTALRSEQSDASLTSFMPVDETTTAPSPSSRSSKRKTSRPVSAPPARPSRLQRRTSSSPTSSTERVPLADKTDVQAKSSTVAMTSGPKSHVAVPPPMSKFSKCNQSAMSTPRRSRKDASTPVLVDRKEYTVPHTVARKEWSF